MYISLRDVVKKFKITEQWTFLSKLYFLTLLCNETTFKSYHIKAFSYVEFKPL